MIPSRNFVPTLIPTLCLFISGAASLVYELVWIRQLTLIFGGTLFAISAVLCAFMTGLALGAWGIVRYLSWQKQRRKNLHPVFLYGILEGLIGLYGLGFPFGLALLEKIYPIALKASPESETFLHLSEFFLSALLMLPPTLLMGATLPLIGGWSIGAETHKIFSRMSLLYSLNTFGAVFGCLYTQLFAIEHLGIRATSWSAVAMNALVFLLCFKYRGTTQSREAEELSLSAKKNQAANANEDDVAPTRTLSLLLLFIFIYSGMASLSSEILWTRVLVFPMGSTLYSFALILATFLFSIALGSLVAEKILGNSRWILKFLLIELAIAIVAIGILPLLEQIPELTAKADALFYEEENTFGRTLFVRSLFAFGLMLPAALGFGILFPLANRIHVSLFGTVTRTLGNSYAFNTMGAVLGTILTPFVFIPLFGIRMALFIIFALLLVLSMTALTLHLSGRRMRLAVTLPVSLLMLYAGYSWSNPAASGISGDPLARWEINVPREQMRMLDYKEGDFATLSVVENKPSGARTLYVNGFSTATVSQSLGGSAYMQAMGFVPMTLHPDPKRALVICFGTGNTLGTVSLFPGVEVDGVEIDRNVLSLAKWFTPWNHNVLERPNTRVIVQDGRAFIRWTQSSYDVITLEPMSPVQAGVVNLYSREFYQEALNRLNAGGIMMQWLPLHLVGTEDARAIIKTFQEVFPHTSVWNSFLTRIVLLVGSREPVRLDKKRFDDLMRVPALAESAREMGVRSFLDLTDFFLTDGEALKPFLVDAPVITDNHPLLEFSPVTLLSPLKWQTDESFLNLLRHRMRQWPPATGLSEAEKQELKNDFAIRTAQRFSVFSRRYHGPGEEAFAVKNYSAAMEAMRIHLDGKKDGSIRLEGAVWKD